MKNESSFEVIIIRGVVKAFYRFEIFCEEKKLGFLVRSTKTRKSNLAMAGGYFEDRPWVI